MGKEIAFLSLPYAWLFSTAPFCVCFHDDANILHCCALWNALTTGLDTMQVSQ
jgi:hypothetical protein